MPTTFARSKPASIRAIDRGTRYDITGGLRKLIRQIECGDYGDVRQVVVGVKGYEPPNCDCRPTYTTIAFGMDSMPEIAYTVDMMKKRTVGQL